MELRSGTVVQQQPQAATPPSMPQEALTVFQQGVELLLNRWTALQLAIHNEWGGPNSRTKAQQLHNDIVTWMVQSKEKYIDELEDMLDQNLVLLFNTETEDGSLEEVAEKVMTIYEECLEGNFETVKQLGSTTSGSGAALKSQQVINAEEEEPEVDMEMDDVNGLEIPKNKEENPTSLDLEEEDGWQTVSSKNKRKPRRTRT